MIPCLLLRHRGLVKTVRFAEPKYIGDPINAVRIFNEKEVDELILLDIDTARERSEPDYDQIRDIVSEAFMPVAYGGGIRTVEQAQRIVSAGVEKVIVNSAALDDPDIVSDLSARLGSSSTVVAIDVKRDWLHRRRVYDACRRKSSGIEPSVQARQMVGLGAGEIFINDVDRDGTGEGFDLDLIRDVTLSVNVPVIVCGGAGKLEDLRLAAGAGAAAVAAGSMFVYIGRHKAVMINYPPYKTLEETLSSRS